MKTVLAFLLLVQLTAPGGDLPQIMSANFKAAAPIKAGRKTDVAVSFNVIKGYVINRTPEIKLTVSDVAGIKLDKKEFVASPNDPKSKDEYFVDLPTLKVPVTVAKAGKFEVPGKLVYFFCSKSDGFCSKQTVDVKIPLLVQ
jgi:hypothetical protein